MLKIYSVVYRVIILIVLYMCIVFVYKANSSRSWNIVSDALEIIILVAVVFVLITLTLFQYVKSSIKIVFRDISLGLIIVLFLYPSYIMIQGSVTPFVIFFYILWSVLSGLLSFELIRYKSPKDIG